MFLFIEQYDFKYIAFLEEDRDLEFMHSANLALQNELFHYLQTPGRC